MTRWYARSIRNKITTAVLMAVVPALLFVSGISALREARQQRQSFSIELAGIAAALGSAVSEPLASRDTRQVANALKGIAAIPSVTYVAVRDGDGRVVFQFGSGILVNAVLPTGDVLAFSSRTLPVAADIKYSGKVIGELFLIADASKIRDGLMRSLRAALLTALVAAVLGVLASARMQQSVTRPLHALKRAMADVCETKNFSCSVEPTSKDETAHLVGAFNDMMREIRHRDEALLDYRDGLERKVEQRTRELAIAVDEAQAANRAKSDFLATMSHEIRTPMNGMLVMAELLAAGDLAPRAQRHCEVILRSGQTLLAIINDVLDLSKIEAGKLTLESVPCDLSQIVDDVLKLFSERAAGKGLELACYVAPDVPAQVCTDPVRVSQILSNLVNNAIKFTERGGVLVRVEGQTAGRIEVCVTDTGIGIPEDKLARIFDPFTQAEQSTTRRFGGTGIGLTICRKLAEAMGGTLTASSALGSGSTFTFDAAFTPVALSGGAEDPGIVRGEGIILTAHLDGLILDCVSRIVADHGFRTVSVHAAYETGDVRGLIAYPGTAPPAFAQGMLADKPLIELTGFGQSNRTSVQRIGSHAVLEMPFSPAELRSLLNAIAAGKVFSPVRSGNMATMEGPQFTGVRALAADDSAINREVLIEALSRLGVEVTCVENGAEAVEAVKANTFDIVFMDGSMPVMDGFDATRAIRTWEAAGGMKAVPVVGLSAHVVGDYAEAWRLCGMSDFITKPFTLGAIRTCLTRWITAEPPGVTSIEKPPVQSAPDDLLDLDVLQSIRDMQPPGTDLVARIVMLYADHAPRLHEKLIEGAQGELPQVASAAHALKSISRNVGALRVGNICGAIEDAAREGRCELASHKDTLRDALEKTLKALMEAGTLAQSTLAPGQRHMAAGSAQA